MNVTEYDRHLKDAEVFQDEDAGVFQDEDNSSNKSMFKKN